MSQLIVTRHPALVKYLIMKGYVDSDVEHVSHADVEDVKDKHVFGVLPLRLSSHCASFTEVQLRLPPEKRGIELSLKDIEFFANKIVTYVIKEKE